MGLPSVKLLKAPELCPNAHNKGGYCEAADEFFDAVICDISEKWCLREAGEDCENYNEIMDEMAREEAEG